MANNLDAAKRFIAWPLFHLCYWTGDATSRLLNLIPDVEGRWYERLADWGVKFYSACMRTSLRLDDWAKLGFWKVTG